MNLRQLIERGDRPFTPQPQVGRYFPAASVEDARRRLGRAVERGDGPGVVIGAAGSGKSLLLQVLAAQCRERFDVVLLACAQLCTRRALLQAIHFELGLDYRRRDEGQLRLSLIDQLLSAEATEGLLLLVDEAQTLAPHLLEELRLLTNLARGGLPRVRLVLAGLPSLEEKLACPELEAFSQRVSARCYLAPLSRDETIQYIRAQMAATAVGLEQTFAASAGEAVFHATDGVPRLVNQLCDRALVLAAERQMTHVDSSVVQAAWADLQQLPTPWEAGVDPPAAAGTSENVVEFGSLAAEDALPATDVESDVIADSPSPRTTRVASPRPPQSLELPLSIDTGRLADRMASMPLINAEPEADVPVEPTELDEADDEVIASTAARPAPAAVWHAETPATRYVRKAETPSRAKPKRVVPPAIDPFADAFDEEEIVLESFASLAGIIGPQAPRVENRREPGFASRVQQALEAAEFVIRDAAPPPLRLAVVAEPPADPALPAEDNDCELPDDPEPILVLEDDADETSDRNGSGVRSENYRNLFTRLRQGA